MAKLKGVTAGEKLVTRRELLRALQQVLALHEAELHAPWWTRARRWWRRRRAGKVTTRGAAS